MSDLQQLNETLTEAGVPHENPTDETEPLRRVLVHEINSRLSPDEQERYRELVEAYGEDDVWDSEAVGDFFTFKGFMAPFAVVTKKETGEVGSLQFSHSPRFYFGWTPDS